MMLFVITQSASMVVSSKMYEFVILALGWILHRLPMTEDVTTALSNIWECEPINVFVPTVHVLGFVNKRQHDDSVTYRDSTTVPSRGKYLFPLLCSYACELG